MTICPCCGFKFHGALRNGCKQCGARAVGEPLPKPIVELPSYGRALVLAVSGSLVVLVFITQTIIAFVQRFEGNFGFWSWIAAGETAAWRLKWISIPVLFAILWFGRKLYRSILLQPERFCGLKHARRGLLASAVVTIIVALLIGITVPARLRHRQWAREAAIRARGYTVAKAMTEYRIKYQSYPAEIGELLRRLPDPDGSLAEALANLDSNAYRPTGDYAAVTTEKDRPMRGSPMRRVSLTTPTDDTLGGGLSFTNYALILPGEDNITGTDDDWVVRDDMIMKQSDIAKGGVGSSVSGVLQP